MSVRHEELIAEIAALHAGEPRPEGGAAAAAVVALAAALSEAAAAASGGSWEDAGGAVAQGAALRKRAARLASENARVHGVAVDALEQREPEPEADAETRNLVLGDALVHAAELPLVIAQTAADAAELGAWVAEHADPAVRPDAVTAATLAAAAAKAAAHLVGINLAALPTDEGVVRAHRFADQARAAVDRALAASA